MVGSDFVDGGTSTRGVDNALNSVLYKTTNELVTVGPTGDYPTINKFQLNQ